ncbi:MAG: hypothetical protein V1891_00825 [bacterium]
MDLHEIFESIPKENLREFTEKEKKEFYKELTKKTKKDKRRIKKLKAAEK